MGPEKKKKKKKKKKKNGENPRLFNPDIRNARTELMLAQDEAQET